MFFSSRSLIHLIISATFIQFSFSSVCVVSHWSEWSVCFGSCGFGEKVRNRRVTRPPFPERNQIGGLILHDCPRLYEIDFCSPTACLNDNDTSADTTMPSQRSQSSMNNAIAQVLSIIDDPMRRMARIHLTRLHSHSQTSTMKNSIDSNATKDAEMHNDEIHPNGHYDEQRSEKHAANTDLVGCNNEKHSEKVKRRVLNTGDAHVEPMDGIIVNGSGVSCSNSNRRCCRVQRQQCPNGSKPHFVTRWYRKIGEEECTSYLYPYCGMGVEADDRPIKYEANCLDICFTIQEKHLRPFLDHYPVNRQ